MAIIADLGGPPAMPEHVGPTRHTMKGRTAALNLKTRPSSTLPSSPPKHTPPPPPATAHAAPLSSVLFPTAPVDRPKTPTRWFTFADEALMSAA